MEHDTFKLHKFQAEAWDALDNPDIREISLQAGIQGGKTTFGALAMLHKVARAKPGTNFIVAADNYKTLSQATIPTFLKYFTPRLGKYNQKNEEFALKRGGKIFFRTSTDANSVEGIPDAYFAWCDEAGKCSRLFKINLLGRVARLKGQVLYTSTPYAMNWLYHEVEKPYKTGERTDIVFIQFSSADNPAFPREEFERQRLVLDQRTFRRKYMGIHERLEGLVYELTGANFCEPITLPKGTRVFAGIDFGFAEGHEFGLVIQAIDPSGVRYLISDFKQSGLDPVAQVQLCMMKQKVFNIEQFYCDPARPDMISLMNKSNLRAVGFHVGNENYKSVMSGVSYIQSLIRESRLQLFRGACTELEDEFETYHWPEDAEGLVKKEEPVKMNDHLLDAMRYAIIGSMQVNQRPVKPELIGNIKVRIFDRFKPTDRSRSKGGWESY